MYERTREFETKSTKATADKFHCKLCGYDVSKGTNEEQALDVYVSHLLEKHLDELDNSPQYHLTLDDSELYDACDQDT